MTSITETLCAIERGAERAQAPELRHITQELLALRDELAQDDRAHANALLLKLDHLEHTQCAEHPPCSACADVFVDAPTLPPLQVEMLGPQAPSHYLVHFYSHDLGDLEKVELADTLHEAAQLVREHLAGRRRHVVHIRQRARDGMLSFSSDGDILLASVEPCEPRSPVVDPDIAEACTMLAAGDLSALQRLLLSPTTTRQLRAA